MNIILDDILNNKDLYYAHIDGNRIETLEEHLNKTYEYFTLLLKNKKIDKILNNIVDKLTCKKRFLNDDEKKLCLEIIHNAIYLHDIGKCNPHFQISKMKNSNFDISNFKNIQDSNHALLSSYIFICLYIDKTKNKLLKTMIYLCGYLISRHHGSLLNINEFSDKLNSFIKIGALNEYCYNIKNINFVMNFKSTSKMFIESVLSENNNTLYILSRLIFSMITGCDFYATSYFMNDNDNIEFKYITKELINQYEESDIYKNIKKYESGINVFGNDSINNLRSDMFLEAEKNLISNLDKNIYYLEAPTGSGKTNTSINLVKNLVNNFEDISNVFYVFPFNTLVEQTYETFEKIFNKETMDNLAIINSTTPINIYGDENEDYNQSLLYKQFRNYPITFTSHVNLFNILFGINRESCFPLINLCNSVIIFDEIQAYKNVIWKEIIHMLHQYSNLLNIKMVIMSATLPKLDTLLNLNNSDQFFQPLINDISKYYQNSFFKDRVSVDFSLLNSNDLDNDILDIIKNYQFINEHGENQNGGCKVLIEFITKRDCREFFEYLKKLNLKNFEIYEISGIDNKFSRKEIIKKISKLKSVIICSTQVIEAGVDIDVDLGFKDCSFIDNEEQFLGRINRSCKKKGCKAYFFNKYNENKLYKGDLRKGITIKDLDFQSFLENKDFVKYYQLVLQNVQKNCSKNKGMSTLWDDFIDDINSLNFIKIYNHMKLINSDGYELFLPYTFKKEDCDNRVWTNYINICNQKTSLVMDGKIVWKFYKNLLNSNISYAKKQILISQMNEILLYFTVPILKEPTYLVDDSLGKTYYIEQYQQFINYDKFDLQLYIELMKLNLII